MCNNKLNELNLRVYEDILLFTRFGRSDHTLHTEPGTEPRISPKKKCLHSELNLEFSLYIQNTPDLSSLRQILL